MKLSCVAGGKINAGPVSNPSSPRPGVRAPFPAPGHLMKTGSDRRIVIDPRPTIPYQAQDRPANCGAYGVYNALLFLGLNPNILDIYKIEAGVRCEGGMGTAKQNVTKFLRKVHIKFEEVRRISIRQVEDALFEGHGVIYLYNVDRRRAHYVFMYGQTRRHFRVANELGKDRNLPTCSRLKSYYLARTNKFPTVRRAFGVFPHAWVIKGWKTRTKKRPVKARKLMVHSRKLA